MEDDGCSVRNQRNLDDGIKGQRMSKENTFHLKEDTNADVINTAL